MLAETLETGHPRLRLDTLTRLRWLAIAGQSAAILFVAFVLKFPTPLVETAAIILAATVLNVVLSLVFLGNHRFDSRTSALLLGFDVLQLSALLFFTGGLQNPFALLFLAPVLISAAALEPRFTVLLGLAAIAMASVLAVYHRPLPWSGGQAPVMPGLYVAGIWVSVALGLIFIGVFAWRVADEARQMARALAATELVLAREQHLTALDGLAAAAAHQLGTPLATIAVVAREMQRNLPQASPLREDVDLLHQEARRCREILGKLASLGTDDGGPLGQHTLSEMLEEVVAPHRNFGIALTVLTEGAGPEPGVPRNPGLIYGLGNLIENAVDFAVKAVTIRARWSASEVTLTIDDDGQGFPPDMLQRLGEPYMTSRAEHRADAPRRHEGGGLGLGLFIAKTLLERSGARIAWGNVPGGTGARIDIVWRRADFGRPAALRAQ